MLRVRALCLGVVTAACGSFLLVSPAQATHLGDPEGISLGANRIAYVAGLGQTNAVTVNRTGGDYTITDTGVGAIPDGDGPGGCSVAGQTATCSATGVTQVFIEVLDGNDQVDGGPGDDTILGGSGGDDLDGHQGNDTIDSGLGDPFDETFDFSVGGEGFNTLTFSLDPERATDAPGPIRIDMRENLGADSDGKGETAINFTQLLGTPFDDEIVGGHQAEYLVGLGGADTLCGGLGVDTVDYSRSTQGVTVTLDGTQPTDQDLAIQLIPDQGGPGTEELRLRYLRARHDCRETLKPEDGPFTPPTRPGDPKPGGTRDCTRDDGAPGENDCVGEDVENIIGSPHNDTLVGNDVDPLEGEGPRVEPHGANLIQGGGGDDVMDGRGGPDVYEGGAGSDTVTYGGVAGIARFGGRGAPVNATIDGAPNDGGAFDLNRASLGDSINTDVEKIIGTLGDDVLRGGAGDEELIGSAGNDFVEGGGGNDQIEGNDGNDAVVGGEGGDLVLGGAGNDDVDGEAGDDDVRGEDGNDVVSGGEGADTLSGGNAAGVDTLDYSDRTTPVRVSLDGVNDDGAPGEGDNAVADFEIVQGGSDDDVLIGGLGSEALFGNDGNDQLSGGGAGDDLSGGPGTDTASYADRANPVLVNLAEAGNDGEADEGDYVLEDVEEVVGGSGDDTLSGDGHVNVLVGGQGDDRLAGAEGDDTLAGQWGNDALSGDVGNDTLFGGDGNDNLADGAGNDDLKGEAGDDNLDGGPGADRHFGGPGIDAMSYASRKAAVTVTLDGTSGNGEKNENDFINHDVESVTTGSGADTIDADDNLRGAVKCGPGTDIVAVDSDDRVNADCEDVQVAALGTRCTAQGSSVRMSKSGTIKLRVFCAATAKGTLRLASVARVRNGKGRSRKILRIGSKSFSLKAGQRRSVSVRASGTARRLIRSKKRLSVRAVVSSKATTQKKTLRTLRVLTVRAPK